MATPPLFISSSVGTSRLVIGAMSGYDPCGPPVHDNCKLLEEQGVISMFRKLVIGALGAMAVFFSTTAFAQGTAADARAMLEKTVAAIKADKAKTLDEINKGENGFLAGDIYPFCFNLSDGLLVAIGNPNVKGLLCKDARTFKDPTG